MVSRTNLNLHPAEQGKCYSHPEKSRFLTRNPSAALILAQKCLWPASTLVDQHFLPSEKSGQRPDSQVVKSGVLATSWVLWFSPRSGMGPPSAIRPIDSERERELTWVATLPS